ncbi:Ig-like domain-containing protein [Treponema sp.]|jgi:hypothetical protein|uniref:Ig-like domain-containing protein n=1 Tax=Treponema sp. TaxID=166 RepID=UPI00257D6F8E|nr:Ig-like domain-containing protein [Treponema sp.]
MSITKKSIALACSAFLALSAAVAQEAEESVTTTAVSRPAARKSSAMEIKGDGEVALHGTDYDGFKSLWVDFHGEDWAKVKWSSSNIKILKVDQKGRLFPRAVGKVTVTATTKDGRSTSREIEVTKYGPAPTSAGLDLELGLSGEAGVTFGTDLDSGKSGFSSYQDIDLKLKVLNVGEIWSENTDGLPIWGEIRVVLDGDPVRYMVDSSSGTDLYTNDGSYSIEVDRAAIHFGPGYITLWDRNESSLGYVNYTTGSDVAYSFMGADTDRRYGQMVKKPLQSYLSSFDEDDTVYGLSAGYEMDGIFSLGGDIASTLKWTGGNSDPTTDTAEQDATDWLYKVYGHLLVVPGLDVQLGYSNGVLGEDSVKQTDMRFGAQVDYQWDFYDIYYLKPSFGVTMVQQENRGDAYPLISGGILLGWEDKQSAFDYWSTKYDEDDHGAYPGLAFNFQYADANIAAKSVYLNETISDLDHDVLILHGSFNTGDGLLVDNLQAVGAVDVIDATNDRTLIGATIGAKYWTPVAGKFSVEPRVLLTRFYDTEDDANDYMFAKACLCLNYGRAHLELNWESNDLIHGFLNSSSNEVGYKGKFEVTAKVAW